jgi:recombination protein RecR
MISQEIDRLIKLLSKLPGLGPRSGRRMALYLIKKKTSVLDPLIATLSEVGDKVQTCSKCGNLDSSGEHCSVCMDSNRDASTICVVEGVDDLWAMERTNSYKGHYHVLGGVLSALDGIGPDDLTIEKLRLRVKNDNIKEIIVALNATLEGQTTAHYLLEKLSGSDLKMTRLAHGVPVGGELDYLDDGTISAALSARRPF